jgi:hypothetical protein
LDNLKKARVFFLDGVPKTFGGAQRYDAAVQRRKTAMTNWTKLSMDACKAEFPEFELKACFSIFDCSDATMKLLRDEDNGSVVRDFQAKSLRRLCLVFNKPFAETLEEFEDFRPIAVQEYKRLGHNFEAWSSPVQKVRTQGRCNVRTRENHPVVHLTGLIQEYGAYDGATTSGVEQMFGKQLKQFGAQRTELSQTLENDETILLENDLTEAELTSIKKQAQLLWVQSSAASRQSCQNRIDKGKKRKATSQGSSEVNFFKMQRVALRKAQQDRKMKSIGQRPQKIKLRRK